MCISLSQHSILVWGRRGWTYMNLNFAWSNEGKLELFQTFLLPVHLNCGCANLFELVPTFLKEISC